jgi:hypothetical protein
MGAVSYTARPRRVDNLDVSAPSGDPNVLITWHNPTHRTDGTSLVSESLDSILVYRDTLRIASLTGAPGDTLDYTDYADPGGYYSYEVVAFEGDVAGMPAWTAPQFCGVAPDVIVYELDPTPVSGALFLANLPSGYTGAQASAILGNEPPTGTQAALVLLGIYSNNHVLSQDEAAPLVSFANNGGSLYMEGGDTWYYDPSTSLHSMFGIVGTSDGTSDLGTVDGEVGTFAEGMHLQYAGENSYIDHLSSNHASSYPLARNTAPTYFCAVAGDFGTYRSVGASWEIGGFAPGSGYTDPDVLAEAVLSFLLGITDAPELEDPFIPVVLSLSAAPNPFNPTTSFTIDLPTSSFVLLEVFDVLGRRAATLVEGSMAAGSHEVSWDATDVASGVYFARLTTENTTATTKVTLLK